MAHDFSEHFWMMKHLIVLNQFIVMNHSKVIHVNELNFCFCSWSLNSRLCWNISVLMLAYVHDVKPGCWHGLYETLWANIKHQKHLKQCNIYFLYLYCQYNSVVNILYTASLISEDSALVLLKFRGVSCVSHVL